MKTIVLIVLLAISAPAMAHHCKWSWATNPNHCIHMPHRTAQQRRRDHDKEIRMAENYRAMGMGYLGCVQAMASQNLGFGSGRFIPRACAR